jgi:hypothetical protein
MGGIAARVAVLPSAERYLSSYCFVFSLGERKDKTENG